MCISSNNILSMLRLATSKTSENKSSVSCLRAMSRDHYAAVMRDEYERDRLIKRTKDYQKRNDARSLVQKMFGKTSHLDHINIREGEGRSALHMAVISEDM